MEEQAFALKGNICYSLVKDRLVVVDQGYVVCEQGRSTGVYTELPERYCGIPCKDFGEAIIIPGLVDLHVHAPQFAFRGLGMDLELLEWLKVNAFPEEARYEDMDYAKRSYGIFTEALRKSATSRAAIFATLHVEATEVLMDYIEASGIKALVGKVNMDRNSPEYLCEKDFRVAAKDTRQWIENTIDKYHNVKPILTPRFIPSCTDELMMEIANLQREFKLPLQSHLSETLKEIAFVKKIYPNIDFYGQVYHKVGVFGGACPTIMAHCVYSVEEEIELMKERGVFIAHCPQSNMNLASGIAPIRTYLDRGLSVGLGSDIAGGATESILRAMAEAIQVSKLYWCYLDQSVKPLTMEEAFYLGTKGGGAFFGKVGSLEAGYEFDAVVLDDQNLPHPQKLSTKQRLERLIYISEGSNILCKYVAGKLVYARGIV